MLKTKRCISIDPRVWDRTQAEARRLRVSSSWVAETALRQHLEIDRRKPRKSRSVAGDGEEPAQDQPTPPASRAV